MISKQRIQRKIFKCNHLACLLAMLLLNELIVETWQQIQMEYSDSANQQQEEVRFTYRQGDQHHIVKRKLKMKSILGGKSKSKSSKAKPSNANPYPKQPAYNPAYSPSAPNSYPKQPAYNPNYPGSHNSNPVGPPPPYPGLNYPHYPQQSNVPHRPPPPNYNYGYQQKPGTFGGNMYGQQRNPFGGGSAYGNPYGSNFGTYRKNKGLGIGKSIGTAGFGALAGTALGAYGGYKLGRMVGNLGRMGHYGYYSDHGHYVKCDPPRTIKVDPETNISYIPLDEDYDRRCSYFDRPPPAYIEPSMLRSAASMISNNIYLILLLVLLLTTVF